MTLTVKQENFCQKYLEIGNAAEAYRLSYETGSTNARAIASNANKLLNDPQVSMRIKELQEEHKQRHNVSIDSLTEELEQARGLALQTEQPSAAVSATMGKAKLHGLLVDKQEISGKDGGPIDYRDVSEEEIERRIIELSDKGRKG